MVPAEQLHFNKAQKYTSHMIWLLHLMAPDLATNSVLAATVGL